MRLIRICHFTPCLWSGGTEERIARVTAAMDRGEFDVSWMGFGPVREALVQKAGDPVRVIPLARNASGGIEPAVILRAALALSRLRPHVLHVHNWSTSLYGIVAGRLAGVPRILYGSGGREVGEGAGERRRRAMRAMAPHVDRLTAVCEFLGREVQADFGVETGRVLVLSTGVDVRRIDEAPSRAEARARLGIPADATVVGTVSVFRPVKRIPDVIEAVSRLGSNVHLLLVGNPVRTTVEALRAQAARLGIQERLHLPGRIEDPSTILKAFDVFVNCSIFEGSSNAIIEAMAARIPVVATAVGGTPELVEDGVTGLLVPPRDVDLLSRALATLTADPALAERLGAAGRRFALAHHTHETMAAQYMDLYRREAALAETRATPVKRTIQALGRIWSGNRRPPPARPDNQN